MREEQKIIVSLTSFPAALTFAAQSIRSILNGSILPDKIVLYLDTQKFPDKVLPKEIEDIKAESSIFEVRFDSSDIRSYKKLLPALKDFPEDIIVTIDDDIFYRPSILNDLIKLHKKFPDSIIAHRVRKIQIDKPYSKWKKYKWYDFIFKKYHLSHLSMQTGVGGVLYPPHSLDEDMLKPEIFMKLAPTNDDIWFWAAAVSKDTYVIPIPNGKTRAPELGKPNKLSLKTINLKPGNDKNKEAFDKILEHYPAIREKILIKKK